MKKLVLAYSGGLDTSYCLKSLSAQGFDVYAISVNTGGFDKKDLQVMAAKAYKLGAKKFQAIAAEATFYEKIVKYLVFGNVLKNNTYPLSVSAERIIQAIEIVNYANSIKADCIAHGSTGAGNDQVRFDLIFQILAPAIEIITPIRDQNLSRNQEIDFLKTNGIDMDWQQAQYSINAGLWGTSIGGKETLTSRNKLPEQAYPSQLQQQPPQQISLSFEQGQLVAIDDETAQPHLLIQQLQQLAGRYAIGRDIHIGDTIIGIKGRVGFEAAAPIVIIKAHHLLEKHTLSKWQQYHKQQLAEFYGMHLHDGQYFDPVMRDIERFLENSQNTVTGKVFINLLPYRFELEGIESKFDLLNPEFGSYGEINNLWSADDAKGFIKVTANAHKIYRSTKKNSC